MKDRPKWLVDAGKLNVEAVFTVHDERVAIDGDITFKTTVYAVVLQHVGEIVGLQQIVNRHNFDVRKVLSCGTEYHAADATEAVDT